MTNATKILRYLQIEADDPLRNTICCRMIESVFDSLKGSGIMRAALPMVVGYTANQAEVVVTVETPNRAGKFHPRHASMKVELGDTASVEQTMLINTALAEARRGDMVAYTVGDLSSETDPFRLIGVTAQKQRLFCLSRDKNPYYLHLRFG